LHIHITNRLWLIDANGQSIGPNARQYGSVLAPSGANRNMQRRSSIESAMHIRVRIRQPTDP
jgi:hypothetical protein